MMELKPASVFEAFSEINRVPRPSKKEEPEEPETPAMEQTVVAEPFSEDWEPDYEAPVAEVTPPGGPIAFENKSRMRQLRQRR